MISPSQAGGQRAEQHANVDAVGVAALAKKINTLPGKLPLMQRVVLIARHFIWWFLYVGAWAAAMIMLVVAVLRVVYHDGEYFLAWVNAFTRYFYLPAYPCLAWAVWQRRWGLACVTSLVIVCHLVWLAPNVIPDRRFAASVADSTVPIADTPTLRVFFANVLQTNREFDAMFEEIAVAEPDVVVFAEWGWRWNRQFQQSPLSKIYVHGASISHPQYSMVNLFSKLPLKNEMQNIVAGRLVRTVDIEFGTETLRIIGLHAPRPIYDAAYDYDGFWQQMIPLLATEASRPLVVVGDFNATEHSWVYSRLKAVGLRSAHDDRGRGYATTWPNRQEWLPPIRIDQAFLSPQVECKQIFEGRGWGSDHKPIIVDVQIRPLSKEAGPVGTRQ